MPAMEMLKATQQKITAIRSGIGRKLSRLTSPIRNKLARWILRKRSFAAYLVLDIWPLLVVLVLVGWSITAPPPKNLSPRLFHAERAARCMLVLLIVAEAAWKRRQRWKRLRPALLPPP